MSRIGGRLPAGQVDTNVLQAPPYNYVDHPNATSLMSYEVVEDEPVAPVEKPQCSPSNKSLSPTKTALPSSPFSHRLEDEGNTTSISMSSSFWTATLPLLSAKQTNQQRLESAHDRTIGHRVDNRPRGAEEDTPFANSRTSMPQLPIVQAQQGIGAYMARSQHVFEVHSIATCIASFVRSVDLILSFRCMHGVCTGAADAELRSRIVQRTVDTDFVHQTSVSHTSLKGASATSTAADSIVRVTLRDGPVRVMVAPKAKSLFVEEPTESYKRRHCGLVWGTLVGPLARELITLPHRRRSDRPLDNFLSSTFESPVVASAVGGGGTVSASQKEDGGAQFPMRSQHEQSRITTMQGWWCPMPRLEDDHQQQVGLTVAASHIYFNHTRPQQSRAHQRAKVFSSVSDVEARDAYAAIHRARTQFPLIFDVTASFLRGPIRLRVSHLVASPPDLSVLVRLPTEPSRSMIRKATGVAVCCTVTALRAIGDERRRESSEVITSWIYETVPVLSPFADTALSQPYANIAVKGFPVIQSYMATTYLHLTKPLAAPARRLGPAIPRPLLAADTGAKGTTSPAVKGLDKPEPLIPLASTVPQSVRLHVFLDGLAQPIGMLDDIPLAMRLSELRTQMEGRLRWMASVLEHCHFRVFRNHVASSPGSVHAASILGKGLGAGKLASSFTAAGNATPRSSNSGGGAMDRRSSARSMRYGSMATITNVPVVSDINEEEQLVVDALPPVRGQYLRQMLEGYEPSICGWMGGEVSTLLDCVLCVVIVPKPMQNASNAASMFNGSTAPAPHDLQSTAAARVRHLRAQKAKDALKEVHPALHMYFTAQGAALDACRRGDVLVLQQVLDGTGTVTSTISPSMKNLTSPVVRLPLELPAVVPSDRSTSIFMHTAAENGRRQVIDLLISRGFPVDIRDSDGQFPLHRAASKGHAECVPILLRAPGGATALNAPDARGRTPLHTALEGRMINTALWLVEQGANPDVRDAAGRSAADMACKQLEDLFSLCRSGDAEAVRLLLQGALPITPAILSSDGDSSQWYMEALKHRLTRGRLLFGLRNQFSVHPRHGSAVENVARTSALHVATECGHVNVVRLLLSEATFRDLVDIYETTSCGDTLLHIAARSTNRAMFAAILDTVEDGLLEGGALREGDEDSMALTPRGPLAHLAARNAAGDTPLHSCLKLTPAAASGVLVHLLTRCQQAPAKYPLEAFGVLVSKLRDGQGLTICHAAVSRAASLPDGVLQALLAAALSASSSWTPVPPPSSNRPTAQLAEYFLSRFPHKEKVLPSRLKDDLRPKSLFQIAVCRGNTAALQLLTDFMVHCVQHRITWLVSDFGALSSHGLLNAAYLRNDREMFRMLLRLQSKHIGVDGLAPFVQLDLTTSQYRRSDDEDAAVECIEIPVAWRIISDARDAAWIDDVLSSPPLVSSLRAADKEMFDYNSVNGAEAAISMMSLVVDCVVAASEERERRRLASRPPPPQPKLTTWGQFLVKPREATREERQQEWSSEQRWGDHRLNAAEKESVLLYALRQLLTIFNPRALPDKSPSEAHLFSRRVLYAAIRCRGHPGAFSLLHTAFDGTHVFSHEDIVRSTNLGVQFGLTPSAGVTFQELKADGRIFTPGSSLKLSRSAGVDGGMQSRGSLLSRGSTTRPGRQGKSQQSTGGGADDAFLGTVGVVETSMGDLFAQDDPHAFEKRMRERESQLCHVIPHIAALEPGAFLHDLCSRRMFGAAMTLLVTATTNAHAAVHAAKGSHGKSGHRRSKDGFRSRSSSPTFALPMTLRQDNVNLRCPTLEKMTGVTALHMAAQFGVTQLLSGLLRTGQFLPREPSEARHWTPMHWAARYGHTETCRALLSIGVPPTDVSDPSGSGSVLGTTPLHLAAVCGTQDLVAVLLEHCAAVDARSIMGRTPLHLSCRKGNVETTMALLEAGANIDREDDDGNTPLLLAAQEGHGQLVCRVIGHLRRDTLLLTINSKNGTGFAHYCAWLGGAGMNQLLSRVLQQSVYPKTPSRQPTAASPQRPSAVLSPSVPSIAAAPLRPPTSQTRRPGDVHSVDAAWLESNSSFVAKRLDSAAEISSGSAIDSLRVIYTSNGSTPFFEKAMAGLGDVVSAASSRPSTAHEDQRRRFGASSRWYGLRSDSTTNRRVGVDAVLVSSGHGRAVALSQSPMRMVPPSDSNTTVVPPRGGSLDALQFLVDATERRRAALLDTELCRHTQLAANVCKKASGTLVLPDSFTVVRRSTTLDEPVALHADRRGAHRWVPLHYAIANGQKEATRIIRDHLGAAVSMIEDVVLDSKQEAQAAAARRAVLERRRSEASLRISFPPVEAPDYKIPPLITAAAKSIEAEVFEPLPPPPPAPRLWHRGYYGPGLEGLTGLFHRASAASCEGSDGASVAPALTFQSMSRRRVTQSLAWQIRRKLRTELSRYLPLLETADAPMDEAGGVPTGATLLMLAAFYDNIDAIDVLVDDGAEVNACAFLRKAPNSGGGPVACLVASPTSVCSSGGGGSDQDEGGGEAPTEVPLGVTPILVASAAGCVRSVHKLIEHGATPDVADECGNTPVHHAVLRKDFDMVKILLHAGAQINVVNHSGDTPEDIAVALRTHSIVRILRWWAMTFRIQPSDLVPMRERCRTEVTYADWIAQATTFYKRLDLLHDAGHTLANKIEQDSVPALMYIRLCQRLKVHPTPSMVSLLVPHWWPEDVRVVRLPGVFLTDRSLVAVFTFVKLLTHLIQFDLCDAKLTDDAVPHLCTAFERHPAIRRVCLSGNRGIGRRGGLLLLELAQTNRNIVGLDLAATGVDAPLNALIQRQVEANMIQQSLEVDDPTKPPPKPVTHKPYHLPRVSALE